MFFFYFFYALKRQKRYMVYYPTPQYYKGVFKPNTIIELRSEKSSLLLTAAASMTLPHG